MEEGNGMHKVPFEGESPLKTSKQKDGFVMYGRSRECKDF